MWVSISISAQSIPVGVKVVIKYSAKANQVLQMLISLSPSQPRLPES